MELQRKSFLDSIKDKLGTRKLVWVGTRGHDARALLDLPQLGEVYGITAPLKAISLNVDFSVEQISKCRVDLDTYSIDVDRSQVIGYLRRLLLESLTQPTVVVAYRPLALLSALCYPRSDYVQHIGMFHERQQTFEHKPWVESELRKHGVPVISWRYFADEDRKRLESYVIDHGPIVVRTNRSNGGAGLTIITCPSDIPSSLSLTKDGFLAAAPFLEPSIPLNVNACIFTDGTVTLHPSSLQLVGIPELTKRRFGYCGNDFAAIRNLDPKLLAELEVVTRKTGCWLWSQGYLGAFGVDALVYEGRVLLAEVNPRFQGSSLLSARIDRNMDRPDVFLCHLAAHLGLEPPEQASLTHLIHEQEGYSQVLYHNVDGIAHVVSPPLTGERFRVEVELLPGRGVEVEPDGTIYRLVARCQVTETGFDLKAPYACLVNSFGLTPTEVVT